MMGNRLTLLLVGLCVLLGALIYFQLQSPDALQRSRGAEIQNRTESVDGSAKHPELSLGQPVMPAITSLTETIDRPLFSADRKPVTQTQALEQTVEAPAPVVTGLPNLELNAVIINGDQRIALLQGEDPGAALIRAEEGQDVEGWVLQEVFAQRIILRRADQEHELVLRKFRPPPQALLPVVTRKIPQKKPVDEADLDKEELDLRRPRRPLRGPRLRSIQKNLQQ